MTERLRALADRGHKLNSRGRCYLKGNPGPANCRLAARSARVHHSSASFINNDIKEAPMIRSSSVAAVAATLAAGLSTAQPALAQDEVDQRFGTVHFATSCNDVAQRRFDRGMRYQHSFWYRAGQGDLRGCAQGRSRMRASPIGASRSAAQQSAWPAADAEPPARAGRDPEGQGGRRQDPARARLHRRARRHVRRLRQDRPSHARTVLSQGDGGAGAGAIPTTTRRRSPTPSRSMSRRHPPTRPMPTSSRARRSSSRSSSASRSIPASPTI